MPKMAGLFRTMGFLWSGHPVLHRDDGVIVSILSKQSVVCMSPLSPQLQWILSGGVTKKKIVSDTKYYVQLLPSGKPQKATWSGVEWRRVAVPGPQALAVKLLNSNSMLTQ